MKTNVKMTVYGVLMTVFTVGQIISAFLLYNSEANYHVINFGWGVLLLSAIFGWLPILTFRQKGQVQGRSYVHTTVLVDSGIYRIVRHPQYLAGVLMSIALPLISQHWLVAVLGVLAAIICYLNTFTEEQGCIDKFGEDYITYMNKVPRINFIWGIIRFVVRKGK